MYLAKNKYDTSFSWICHSEFRFENHFLSVRALYSICIDYSLYTVMYSMRTYYSLYTVMYSIHTGYNLYNVMYSMRTDYRRQN